MDAETLETVFLGGRRQPLGELLERDEKPGSWDIEKFSDGIDAFDERRRSVELDPGFLVGHCSACWGYALTDVSSPSISLMSG